MSYEKQNFEDGQVLTAAQLNHIEDGIAALEDTLSDGTGGLTDTASVLLISILRNAVYVSDQSAIITALESALASSGGNDDSGGSGGNGETQTITFAQTGSVLTISGIDNITTVTQTGSVLALT